MRKEIIGNCCLYNADYREVVSDISALTIVTDPPFPKLDYGWEVPDLSEFSKNRGFYFWMNMIDFPLKFTARHIWGKPNVFLGGLPQYETIYEVNGGKVCTFYRHTAINNRVSAQMARDVKYDHPCQKPVALMRDLIKRVKGDVLDPFMGSGTTGVACAEKGIGFIGIEKDARYFDMACERISKTIQQSADLIENTKDKSK